MAFDARLILPFLRWTPQVTRASLRADALAALTGAAIVLPQGIAFSAIAGMPPEHGIFTAIVAAIVAALFGSSRVMVSGPNTPLCVVIFATVAPLAAPGTPLYVALVLQLTVMVGALQILAAAGRLGAVVSFISNSVMAGFTAAAAILIAVSQVSGALGLHVGEGGTVAERLGRLFGAIGETNGTALAIALVTLVTVASLQRISRLIPGFLIALAAGSLLGLLLDARAAGVDHVGALPRALPSFDLPAFRLAEMSALAQGAAALALIGLLQALSIGRTLAIRRKERFDPTQEIWGQGLANIAAGVFQGYASSGSFTRSGINHDVGAATPVSAVLSSVFLALLVLAVLPLMAHVPVPAMAGLILYVAYRLIDKKEIRHILRGSRSETAILALTFATGLLVALDFAVYVGVIASLFAFIRRSSQPVVGVLAPKLVAGVRKFVPAKDFSLPECPQVTVLRIDGALYFGSTEHVMRAFRRIEREQPQQRLKVMILKGVGDIDLAGADLLLDAAQEARARGGDLHLIVQGPLVTRLARLGVSAELGPGSIHASKAEAIEAAVRAADNEICRGCRVRCFHECSGKPGARAAMRELGY